MRSLLGTVQRQVCVVLWPEWELSLCLGLLTVSVLPWWLPVSGCGITWYRASAIFPVPPFSFLTLKKSGLLLNAEKEAWTQCRGTSSQAGQKKWALAACPCLALNKTSIWKMKVNEECFVWEDWYRMWSPARPASRQEFTTVQHALCQLWCSPTSELFSEHCFSEGLCREHPFSPTLLSTPFYLLSVLCSDKQNLQWLANLAAALFCSPLPPLSVFSSSCVPVVCSQPVVVLCSGFALTNPQPRFLCVFWSGSYLQTLCCE